MKLVLGSSSPYRQRILREAGYKFEIMEANIDEKAIRNDDYELLPIYIAQAKAAKLISQINTGLMLITADQVVVCNGELREKPESREQAVRYLESYMHYPAQTNSAVIVTNTRTGAQAGGIDVSKVYFKNLTPEVIEDLVYTGKPLKTAGGFLIDDKIFDPYIDHIEGDRTGIIGLPINLMEQLIKKVK